MSAARATVAERVERLRLEFDRNFADPPRTGTATKEDLLAIRLGERGFAVRLSEVAGLFSGKTITRVPGASAALLGIAGFRGSIVPVYDLQCLLGHPGGDTPRWLVMAAAAPVALAFAAFEGQLRVSPEAIVPQQPGADTPGFARDYVRTQNLIRPIVHLPAVLDAIKL